MNYPDYFLSTCLLAIAISSHASTLPADWQHEQHFDISRAGLVKIDLPPETLNYARPALEDLRLSDDAGNEVPYLIEHPMPSTKAVQAAKAFSVVLDTNNTLITLETGLTQPIDAVALETPAVDFVKAVHLEGSADGIKWRRIASGQPIFRQSYDAVNLKISFAPSVFKSLRLIVDDSRSMPIPFTGALIFTEAGESVPLETIPVQISERDENPGVTRLAVNLGTVNLDVAGLRLETSEPLFTRQISIAIPEISEGAIREQTIGQTGIYRIAVEGQARAENLYVPVGNSIPTHELILFINNGDSPPLQIRSVSIDRRPINLIFLARVSGTYHLLTGNPYCPSPRYDLPAPGMNLKTVAISQVKISPVEDNPNFHAPEVLPGLEPAGAPLDVSHWRFRKEVKTPNTGAQKVELDADVLAHANPDFADLRLMRGGNQVPYIIERTSISCSITPSVTITNDAREPRVSRWILKLPQAGIPFTSLDCVSTTLLFQRELHLYEKVADDHGEKIMRGLGDETWTQTPDRKNKNFSLALEPSPQTDTLYLETDNGDNPPIQLEQFKFYYPVTRILFKAEPNDNLYLYYGNEGVEPPNYDLSLVAKQLLAADKNAASLASEEQLRKTSSWNQNETSEQDGVLFWAVLALVVMVLLVVISRLLPKASPPPQS